MTIENINITDSIKNAEELLRNDKNLSPQVKSMMSLLILVINLLINKLNLNSTNSSKPPSQDPFRKRGSKQKAKGTKRKPGGQPGHEGNNLKKM